MTSLTKASLALVLCLLATDTRAQLTHTFTETVRNEDHGGVEVAVGPDGTVFLADGEDGLWAYAYDGAFFTAIAHVNDGGWATGAAVSLDGTVFLANGEDGLRAYAYDGTSLTSTAHIFDGGGYAPTGVAVGPEGTDVLTHGLYRLRAYRYDGSSFANMAQAVVGAITAGVAVGPHGTMFGTIAGYCQPTAGCSDGDGLRAYNYDSKSLVHTAHVHDQGWAEGVAVAPDGTVFLANGEDGLRAYAYDGASFNATAHVNDGGFAKHVAVSLDGTVFLANGNGVSGPIWAKSGTQVPGRSWEDSQHGQDHYALRAYSYNGTSLTNTAHIENEAPARGLAVGPDGTVFLTTSSGLIAYTYAVGTESEGEPAEAPAQYSLSQNYPNPFNPTTTISYDLPRATEVTLTVHDVLGRYVGELASGTKAAGHYEVSFDAAGLPSGFYFYRLQAGDYAETKRMVVVR